MSTGAFLLSNRTVLITGASRGLGFAIADALLAAGAKVMISARGHRDLEVARLDLAHRNKGARVASLAVDVSDEAGCAHLFAEAERIIGKVDILINNAGIHGPIGTLDSVDARAWTKAVATNLFGPMYLSRLAIQSFRMRPEGMPRRKIVNLSGGGATAPQPGLSAYGASKAGLVRLTEVLAHECREFADVNAVAPGALPTRLMDELVKAGPERIGEAYHQRVAQLQAGGGFPIEKAADLCLYLASPDSDHVTGRLISAAWDPWPFSTETKAQLADGDTYTLRRTV